MQILQRRGGDAKRELRIQRDRERQLEALAEPTRPCPHPVHLEEDGARVGEQGPPFRRQGRPVARAVEQPYAKFGLQVRDRLAYGRLHP